MFSVVLPCFNEELNIEPVVLETAAWLIGKDIAWEIVVVNDGSVDGTAAILSRLTVRLPELRIVTHERNRGYGAAVRSGCDAAQGEIIGFMDSDGQFRAADFDRLLPHLLEYAFVTGRRRKRADPPLRRFNAKLFGLLAWTVLGIWVRDINCAMKVFTKETWNRVRPTHSTGALINAEMFYLAKHADIPWFVVDVPHAPRKFGTQTGAKLRVILRMFQELWKVKQMPTLRAPSTASRSSTRQRWTAIAVLSLVLLAGLIIRLKVAPAEGYGFDVGTNKSWAYSAVILGPGRSYTQQLKDDMLPNYPPLSILFFQLSGWVYMHTISPMLDIDAPAFQIAIKSGSMVADLLTAVLLYAMLSRYKRNRWWGIAAAAIYLFHPVPIHDGAFWGQTDSEYAVFLVAAFGAFAYGLSVIAGCCMALALLTKFQAVACLPLFVFLILRSGWKSTLKAAVGGFAVTALVLLPFWWTGFFPQVMHVYTSAIGYYDSVSSSAYNFWWSLYADEAGNMHDTVPLFGVLSFRKIGLLLFALSALFPIIVLWRQLKPSPKTGETLPAVFLAATVSAYAFFLWNTQMHERYSFAVIPLGLVVAFASPRAARLYALVSVFIFLNFLGWLPIGFIDKAAYSEFPMLDVFVASALVLLFFRYASLALDMRRMIPIAKRGKGKCSLTLHEKGLKLIQKLW